MEVEFLNTEALRRRLQSFIEEYSEFHWAVAWGACSPLSERLFEHRTKFRNVTFGVAFSQTDPDIVDALVGVPNAYVATKFPRGTYHPKVYGFRRGKWAAAIIGSANFTHGGLGHNHEAAVAIIGTAEERALVDILQFAETSANYGQEVTKAYAAAYRASCKRAAGLPKPPRNPVPTMTDAANAELLTMEWADYLRRMRASRAHNVGQSLELLGIARRWFAEKLSFANFSPPRRKAVAGIIGKYQKTDAELDRDWGWFGSMRGMGDFANRIENNDRSLARAIDGIPRSGEVTRPQYERFCVLFRQAFAGSARTGGVPTATRLLAMKRPDTFLCVCRPNIVAAADALGFARTTLDLDNYWERVVEPIRLSVWYNVDKPDGTNGELWEARAAMLDVLFYRP
ncbi:phospholipase D family protein [Mesorhizobium ciceri]|uniref:phospholipase D family protein n=1 Tax=Mesorhizobium TaxID=68287 RepID=UPI00047EB277|nr:phospholipase D family protein [Mesorhizobium ciceri]